MQPRKQDGSFNLRSEPQAKSRRSDEPSGLSGDSPLIP